MAFVPVLPLSVLGNYFFIKFRIIRPLFLRKLDCCPRVLVQKPCHHVLEVKSPYHSVLFQLIHVSFDKLDCIVIIVLWIAQKAKQQFHRAVSCTSAHAGICGIQPVHTVPDRLNRIGKCKLLVVVCMDSQFFAVFCSKFHIDIYKAFDLLWI